MKLSKSEQKELNQLNFNYVNSHKGDRMKMFNSKLKDKIQERGVCYKLNSALLLLIIALLVFCIALKLEALKLQRKLDVKPISAEQQVKNLGTPPPPFKLVGGY